MSVDRVLGAGAVLLAILVGAAAWRFGVGTPKSPGAGFWPLLIVTAMAGLGVELFLRPGSAVGPGWDRETPLGEVRHRLGEPGLLRGLPRPSRVSRLPRRSCSLSSSAGWKAVRGRSSSVMAVLSARPLAVVFRMLLKIPLPVGIVPLSQGLVDRSGRRRRGNHRILLSTGSRLP